MGYPPQPPWWPPPAPPPPPKRSAGDVAVSVVLMLVTLVAVCGGALMALFSLAFLDHCPPGSCSVEGAVTAAMMAVVIAGFVAVAGIITTIVRLATRTRAWPFALGTLALCVGVFFLGGVAYTLAVG